MSIWIYVGIAIGSQIIGAIWIRSKKTRYPQSTVIDRSVWKIRMMSVTFGVVVFVGTMFFNTSLWFHAPIYSDNTPEQKIQKLIDHDEELREQLKDLQDSLFLIVMVVALYLTGVGTEIGKMQAIREQELENETPLGL